MLWSPPQEGNSMSKQDVKNQHYVPRVYLQRFANAKGQIWVYNKEARKSFQTNIKNVASENRFYDSAMLEAATGDKQFIERHLSNIEANYATVAEGIISSLNARKFKTVNKRHRHFLSAYVVIQWMRTKEARIEHQQMAEVFQKMADKMIIPKGQGVTDGKLFGKETPEEIAQEMQHRALLDIERIAMMARVLRQHIWIIFEAPRDVHFVTSDHPFARRPHITDPLRGTNGIACEGIEIMFPLSTRYLLAMYERKHFHDVSVLDGSSQKIHDAAQVEYFNQFQVFESSRFVFSREEDFSQVEEILNRKPIYGEANRKRLLTNQDDLIGRAGDHHSK